MKKLLVVYDIHKKKPDDEDAKRRRTEIQDYLRETLGGGSRGESAYEVGHTAGLETRLAGMIAKHDEMWIYRVDTASRKKLLPA